MERPLTYTLVATIGTTNGGEMEQEQKHVLGRLDEVKGLVQEAADHMQQAAQHHDSAMQALSGAQSAAAPKPATAIIDINAAKPQPNTAIIDINDVKARPDDGIGLVGGKAVLPASIDNWLTREEGRVRNAENTVWTKVKAVGVKTVEYAIVGALGALLLAGAYLKLHG